MTFEHWSPQLSALALLDAHSKGDYEAFRSIVDNTGSWELQQGLLQVCDGLMITISHNSGFTVEQIVEAFRDGILATVTP